MPFDSGSFSTTMCKLGHPLPDDILSRFAEKRAHSLASVLDEPQHGWVSGRHLLEERIDDLTAFAGGHIHLALRIAQRKIPASLFRAECRMRELAAMEATHSDFVTRKQRRDIREEVQDELLKTMPPTLSGIPFVIDATSDMLYLGTVSPKQLDLFLGYFYETLGFEPIPLTPELAADSLFNINVDLLSPLAFSDDARVESSGMCGRDFATWMWYFQDAQGGVFAVDDLGEFSVMIEGPLVFAADGPGALETLVRKGLPTVSAEARAALLVGKKIRQARFTIARDREVWSFTLDADTFGIRTLTLPQGEELDPNSRFQERMFSLGIFRRAFFTLYKRYLDIAVNPAAVSRLAGELQAWASKLGQ